MTQLKSLRAPAQPWRTPHAMEKHSEKSFPTRTQLSCSADNIIYLAAYDPYGTEIVFFDVIIAVTR